MKETYNYERHKSLFNKGKLVARGSGTGSMFKQSKEKNINAFHTTLEVDIDENKIGHENWRIYERQRVQDGKPASYYHKGTDKVAPYGYKRDIIFGETAIARDIANVKKRRG